MCEEYALTGTRPDRDRIAGLVRAVGGQQVDVDSETHVVLALLRQFDGWLQRVTPSYMATEVCVYSPTYGYAGQADGFLAIAGTRLIIDCRNFS